MSATERFDVIIVGGGPAGATCALQLRHSGLRILLIDKAVFPRQKICGDAVVGRSIKTLFTCCPELITSFRQFSAKAHITKTRLTVNHHKPFVIHWVNEAYCCTRLDFDNFLMDAVKQYAPNVQVLEDLAVDFVEKTQNTDGTSRNSREGGLLVGNQAKQLFFETKMVVGCDGAHSIVSKKLTDTKLSQADHAGAVRAYYKGVKGLDMNQTEVFLSSAFSPGYLWIFPITEDLANVGFGMLTQKISEKRLNLRTALSDFIQASPILRGRFEGSEQVGKVEGFGLPLGSRRVPMSGDHFLLAGDAASLIDPASGDGISNAIVSGKLAADTIVAAYKSQDFSALGLKQYETKVLNVLGKELRQSTLLLRASIKAPFIIGLGAALMNFGPINRLVKRLL